MASNDADWLPSTPGTTMGAMDETGEYHDLDRDGLGSGRDPRNHNRLQHHPDERIANLGEWFAATPADMPTGMAAMGGLMVAFRFAQLYPEMVDEMLAFIVEPKAGDMGPLDDVVDSLLNGWDE